MKILDPSDESVLGLERRQEPRKEEREQIAIRDTDAEGNDRSHLAWSFNASSSGISFRCRDVLSGPVSIEFGPEDSATAYIIWSNEVIQGVWEYGASLEPVPEPRDDLTQQLAEEEIQQWVAIPVENSQESQRMESESAQPHSDVASPKSRQQDAVILRIVAVAGFSTIGAVFAPSMFQVPFFGIAAVSLIELWRRL